VLAGAAFLVVASFAVTAHADPEAELRLGVDAMWTRAMPRWSTEEVETPARTIPEGRARAGGAVFGMGGYVDTSLRLGPRLTLPFVGIGVYGAIGSYAPIVTSVDGSIARVRPWTYTRVEGLGPGLGYRVTHRRWTVEASLRGGFLLHAMNASVAAGAERTDLPFTAVHPLILVGVDVCRRLDPTTRLCLHTAPRVYDGVFMNGATFGLRMEWGE